MKKNGFADRLKALLKQKQLTLAQVAKGVGTSIPSVHRWSNGGEIEYENLRALADFLEVNWIWLRYGDDALASAQEALAAVRAEAPHVPAGEAWMLDRHADLAARVAAAAP